MTHRQPFEHCKLRLGRSPRPWSSSTRQPPPAEKFRGPGKDRESDFLPGRDHGAVTAEFAVALPAVLLLLALLLAGSAAGITQLRLEEAARAGARALARGDGHAVVDGIVRRLAGDAASAVVAEDGEWIQVTVSARVAGPLGSVIPWSLSATASARGETPRASESPLPSIGVDGGVVDFNGALPETRFVTAAEEVVA
ncbi:TadE family type IV pilus minor pilin [Arthrobacter sp. MA-N2]|uniref:TadE family type IV pilus minor pilin n=1 Tax=Arthrobacter sp. MA-N2 TaxID=1101188 RepID=UPI0009E09B8C